MSSNNNTNFAPPQKHHKSPQEILNNISRAVENTKSVVPHAFIQRVPKDIRGVNGSAYTPRLVSIGPLHLHCEPEQQHILKSSMQDIKMYYVDSLLDRVSQRSSVRKLKLDVLKECIDEMKQSTEDAKKCYAEQVEVLDEEMLVIDGCFILELLYRYCHMKRQNQNQTQSNESSYQEKSDDNDLIFNNRLTFVTVQHDLLLVENQLPFLVLEKLFSLTVNHIPNRSPAHSLSQYVLLYFDDMMRLASKKDAINKNSCSPGDCILSVFPGSKMNPKGSAPPPPLSVFPGSKMNPEGSAPPPPLPLPELTQVEYRHILHIVHDHYSLGEEQVEVRSKCWKFIHCGKFMEDPPKEEDKSELIKRDLPKKKEAEADKSEFMPCASELVYAGVKFEACSGEHPLRAKFSELQRPLGWFHRACFEIPTLYIDDSTELFLRNLIAFEQCLPGVSSYFTSYALLMDRLVNDENDIKVLEKAGVICNNLGTDKEAYDLFNKLCKEVVKREFHYSETCTDAFNYSNRCWPAAIGYVRCKYFATPWTFIAFCAAFILFSISVTQFIRSFHP